MRRIILFVLALVWSLPAAALDVRELTTPGGIDLWFVEDHTIPILSADIAFRGGAADDPADKAGLSKMAMSLLDEGAGDMDAAAFQAALEERGISLGFDAGSDTLSGELTTLTLHAGRAFELLALALGAPRFDEQSVEKIRAQLLGLIARGQQSPDALASQAWFAMAFPDDGYGRPADGTLETVKALSRADLQSFAKTRLVKSRLVVSVVGAIDEATLVRLVDQAFAGLPEGEPWTGAAQPLGDEPGFEIVRMDIPQSVVYFGLPGLKRDHPDYIPAFVMSHILGGGVFTSRLGLEVREKRGLAYGISMRLTPYQRAGIMIGRVGTRNDAVAETLTIVRDEIRKMAAQGVTEEELEAAKTYLTGAFPLRFDTQARIAGQLLGLQLYGIDKDYFNRRNALIEAVTLDDVNRMARQLLDTTKFRIALVGNPDPKPGGVHTPTAE